MSLYSNGSDPLETSVNFVGGQGEQTRNQSNKEVQPLYSTAQRPINLYDDPISFVMDNLAYKFAIVLCLLQSNSVLVFLRHRIGRRIMRGWIFQMLFIFLMCASGLGVFFTHDSIDVPLAIYALLMGLLAIYHHSVGKELTEVTDPNLKLHTMSRGDSHLMRLMSIMPRITIPVYQFYRKRFKKVRLFPLGEPTVQRVLEPIFLLLMAAYFSFWQPSFLGGWLALSAITLLVVESDYHTRALNTSLDLFDAQIEAGVMREVQTASHQGNRPTHDKINGISVATASEQMLRLVQRTRQS